MSLHLESLDKSSDEGKVTMKPLKRPHVSRNSQPPESSRPKNSFAFAHPPSQAFYRKLRLRPRLLLQLQQLSDAGRPTPLLDLLESTSFSRKMVPTIFKGANRVLSSDFRIVKSGSYTGFGETVEDQDPFAEDTSIERLDVVATVSHPPRAKDQKQGNDTIHLRSGLSWDITSLTNGSYQFTSIEDDHRRTVRWVCRRKGSSSRASTQPELEMNASKSFRFSIINQGTRRHPVIATMTQASIEVSTHFSLPVAGDDGSSPLGTSTASDSSAYDSEGAGSFDSGEPDMSTVNEELCNLILITGSWVAVKEGWAKEPPKKRG